MRIGAKKKRRSESDGKFCVDALPKLTPNASVAIASVPKKLCGGLWN